MIFFRATNSINIKITDGTILKYNRFKAPIGIENETIYLTTYDDFNDLKDIFAKVDKSKYNAKIINEQSVLKNPSFPTQLGVIIENESIERLELKDLRFLELKEQNFLNQLKSFHKSSIKIAIIGSLGSSISQMISGMAALRIFYNKLKEIYKVVKLDIYIKASNNSYYNRDKSIYLTQDYINEILPLAINSKAICEYDYFVDNSIDITKILDINPVDAWLFKFGIDYKKISDLEKFSQLKTDHFELTKGLKQKIQESKQRGKLLLFHPYSANINKSIPQNIAIDLLKELLSKADEYMIISTLLIDVKIKDDRFIDLSKDSKNINDFIYIISAMDKIITTDTSTYHISDAFMIPTIVFFTDNNYLEKIKYFKYIKPIFIEDKSKNLSKFVYENDNLIINKFESWNKLKVNKIIKLLDNF